MVRAGTAPKPTTPFHSKTVRLPSSFAIRGVAFESDGDDIVDLITRNLLQGFAREYEIPELPESDQFERFSAFCMMRRHYSRSFDIEEIMTGGGGDTAIDALAIIVNNMLVTDVDTIDELAEQSGHMDVTFVFVQSERSDGFTASKIGDFGFGVRDFFDPNPTIPRNEHIQTAASLVNALFAHAAIMKRPLCHMYYVTTGKWQEDSNLSARRDQVVSDIEALGIFGNVHFTFIGAQELHNTYSQTKNAVTRVFEFKNRNDLPAAQGIAQAFIGYVPLSQFLKIISDESGPEILGSIFYDNVRDWQEYNPVNQKIKETLTSIDKNRFVFMNNGVTIIARSINPIGSTFTLSDFQIVNGCQTSNVLFDQRDSIDDTVCVPLRLIETRDEAVMDAIIEATNSQTEVKPEQYFARLRFARRLEQHFAAIDEAHRLHYERRDGQYDRGSETKTRVISSTIVIRAFAAMYLEEPHRTTRGYKSLRERVGEEIFGEDHRLEPYYAASYAHYLLETRFRTKNTLPEYKPARYHILLAVRLQVDREKPTFLNSREMGRRAENLSEALWDSERADALFSKAVEIVDRATEGNLDRDHVRTISVRNNILSAFDRSAL